MTKSCRRQITRKCVKGGCGTCLHNLIGGENESLAQGVQYLNTHVEQHGGEAPVSAITDSSLPADLRISARVTPLDGFVGETHGMRDPYQAAGGKRRHRKNRKSTRKTRRSTTRKARHMARRSVQRKKKTQHRKRQAGGSALYNPLPGDAAGSGMLLNAAQGGQALRGMNPEWMLAGDPKAFAPRA